MISLSASANLTSGGGSQAFLVLEPAYSPSSLRDYSKQSSFGLEMSRWFSIEAVPKTDW
jgi:hypothetical protein